MQKNSSSVQNIILLGLLVRMMVAYWNGFFGPSFGAEADAYSFHLVAVDFSQNISFADFNVRHVYPYFLGIIYFLITDSLFLGSLLSCIAWFFSAQCLIKISQTLFINPKVMYRMMLIYAFLPSAILFTSVTLRESYQLLFVNLAIYSSIMIFLKKDKRYWPLLLCAVTGAGALHGTLFVFGVFTIAATLVCLALPEGRKIPILKIMLAMPLAVLAVYYGLSFFTSATNYKLEDGVVKAVETYQLGGLGYLGEARAFYRTSLEINGITGFILFVPVSLLQYLFEPMPWRITTVADVELFIENTLRAWLLFKALRGNWNSTVQRRAFLFILSAYAVIETTWSLGTLNWGTAVRHHIPGMGMLLVIGFAYASVQPGRTWRRWFNWIRRGQLISSSVATE